MSSSRHSFRSTFPLAFPKVVVDTRYEHPIFRSGLTVEVLRWLLQKDFTGPIGVEEQLPLETFPLVFSFQEVWHSLNWAEGLVAWVQTEAHLGRTYPVEVVKLNNLRWLFDSEGLRSLLRVFPHLTRLQFVGAEVGEDDDETPAKLTTAEAKAILGAAADVFSL